MLRRSETMGADNCHCAVKVGFERWNRGDPWTVVGVDVTRHCASHDDTEYALDDPWDI